MLPPAFFLATGAVFLAIGALVLGALSLMNGQHFYALFNLVLFGVNLHLALLNFRLLGVLP